jgi:hypothetical protein
LCYLSQSCDNSNVIFINACNYFVGIAEISRKTFGVSVESVTND